MLPEGPLDTGVVARPQAPPSAEPATRAVALLPRGVGDVVDTAIALYRRNAKLLIGTVAVVFVPVEFLSAFLNRNLFTQIHQLISSLQTSAQTGVPPSGRQFSNPLASLLLVVAAPLLFAAITAAAASSYLGRPMTVGQAWRASLRRFWGVLGLGILYALIVGFGTLFFVVPGIFLSIQLLVSMAALIVESAGPTTALDRSWRLVRRCWWRTFGVAVLAGLLYAFLIYLVVLPSYVLGFFAGGFGWLIVAVGTTLAQVVIVPLFAVAVVVDYFDLRIRKEAFDLAVSAQHLQALPAVP